MAARQSIVAAGAAVLAAIAFSPVASAHVVPVYQAYGGHGYYAAPRPIYRAPVYAPRAYYSPPAPYYAPYDPYYAAPSYPPAYYSPPPAVYYPPAPYYRPPVVVGPRYYGGWHHGYYGGRGFHHR